MAKPGTETEFRYTNERGQERVVILVGTINEDAANRVRCDIKRAVIAKAKKEQAA